MTDDKKSTGLRKGLTAYGDAEFSLFLRTAFIKAMGYSDDALARPIVGIANTYSGYNACHQTVPSLVEAVRRGVQQAGGPAVDFPTISLHESFAYPTSMLYRNLMAMDTEEMLGAQPMDAVVLIGGCDKTVPAQLMAAASAKVPALVVVTGPMMTGSHRGNVWAPAPTAGASGAGTGAARSTPKRSRRSVAGWRQPRAPAWSWARPAPWPA